MKKQHLIYDFELKKSRKFTLSEYVKKKCKSWKSLSFVSLNLLARALLQEYVEYFNDKT